MDGIYARQSLDKKDSLSIETQIDICRQENGNAPYISYIDKGYSGRNTNRPQFTQMMRDIRAGKINRVYVYKLDRLSRSILDFATMIDLFNQYGVAFISAKEKFDTTTPIGNAMLSIIMVFAQLERETIQIRVKDAYYARSAKGAYDGAAPYGYKKATDYSFGKKISTIEPDESTTGIVQWMFDAYAYNEMYLGEIAKKLNKDNVLSPRGVEWDSSKISRILSNPIYVQSNIDIYTFYKSKGVNMTNQPDDYMMSTNGCITYGAWDRKRRKFTQWNTLSISIGLHKGIVPSQTFIIVAMKLFDNIQIPTGKEGKHSWLTGIIKCAYCHKALVAKRSIGHEMYFKCSGKINYGTCDEFDGLWKISDLEQVVEKEIKRALMSKNDICSTQSVISSDENNLKLSKIKLSERLDRLVTAIADGEMSTSKAIAIKILEMEEEIAAIEKQLEHFKERRAQEGKRYSLGSVVAAWENIPMKEKRSIAKTIINTIEVSNGGIEIRWKYNFHPD